MLNLIKTYRITSNERGLLYRDREFEGVLKPGEHRFLDLLNKVKVETVSILTPRLVCQNADVIAKSGKLGDEALVVEVKDQERGLVFVDERFVEILTPGTWVFWTAARKVRVETINIVEPRLEHASLPVIVRTTGTSTHLEVFNVDEGFVGVYFKDGRYVETFKPGVYTFWKGSARLQVRSVDVREILVDVPGQELMTADRVTLRLNANVMYRVADPVKALTKVADHAQALYREVQLALRAVVGTRELDVLLADKENVAAELVGAVRPFAAALGLELITLGIRDVILPGEMKELLNKVVEARKAAEAALITRREETASIRSQANTAKIYETSPTLLRLRELETLEKIAAKTKLSVVLGDGKLTDRVVKLI